MRSSPEQQRRLALFLQRNNEIEKDIPVYLSQFHHSFAKDKVPRPKSVAGRADCSTSQSSHFVLRRGGVLGDLGIAQDGGAAADARRGVNGTVDQNNFTIWSLFCTGGSDDCIPWLWCLPAMLIICIGIKMRGGNISGCVCPSDQRLIFALDKKRSVPH
jgi:hypothetical protein